MYLDVFPLHLLCFIIVAINKWKILLLTGAEFHLNPYMLFMFSRPGNIYIISRNFINCDRNNHTQQNSTVVLHGDKNFILLKEYHATNITT